MLDFKDVLATFTPFTPEHYDYFYSHSPESHPVERCCIGHLRGDFGRGGDHFWSSWWDHQLPLKTPAFKEELNVIIDGLRDGHILKDLAAMKRIVSQFPEAHPQQAWEETYLFELKSADYLYFLRCFTLTSDYNFYLYCYHREMLEQYESTIK